jgi:hypothetical protein
MTHPNPLHGRGAAARSPWRRLGAALALAAVLGACGGGGEGTDSAGVGTGGTGSFGVGIVTGLGSVFVGGIRYEDNGARLLDDDGNVTVLGTDDNPLKVGMAVEVSGRIGDDGVTRTATQIAFGAEVRGPVTAVDAATGSFTVFGIPVRTGAATVFANFGGVASLGVGHVVEVHGQSDTDGSIVATYIEREATSTVVFIGGDGEYRVRGVVAGLRGTAPTLGFTVRGVAVSTDARTDFDGTPVDGAAVSVRLDPVPLGDGSYAAERVKLRSSSFAGVAADSRAEVEGYVSGFTGAGSAFRVGGYAVRLASGVVYEDGVAADLQDGVRVEAEGTTDGGVLVATKLEFKSRDDDGDGVDDDVSGGGKEAEFKGTASCVACASGSGSFTIKGVTVSYDAATDFRDNLGGSTLDGKIVEVRAVGVLTSSGTRFRATRIGLDD